MIVVVEPIINIPLDVLEAMPGSHLVGQLILHVPIEALLGCIVPAITPAGHALPQAQILNQCNKTNTGIMETWVTVDECFLLR